MVSRTVLAGAVLLLVGLFLFITAVAYSDPFLLLSYYYSASEHAFRGYCQSACDLRSTLDFLAAAIGLAMMLVAGVIFVWVLFPTEPQL